MKRTSIVVAFEKSPNSSQVETDVTLSLIVRVVSATLYVKQTFRVPLICMLVLRKESRYLKKNGIFCQNFPYNRVLVLSHYPVQSH